MPHDDVINRIIGLEGDFSNVKGDLGGATKYGISIGTLKSARGGKATQADVKRLTLAEARQIYEDLYIHKPGFDQIKDPAILTEILDAAVHFNVEYAKAWLQQIVGIDPVDYSIGPKTIQKLDAMPRGAFVLGLEATKFEAYASAQDQFILGFAKRALAMFEFYVNDSASAADGQAAAAIAAQMRSDFGQLMKMKAKTPGDRQKRLAKCRELLRNWSELCWKAATAQNGGRRIPRPVKGRPVAKPKRRPRSTPPRPLARPAAYSTDGLAEVAAWSGTAERVTKGSFSEEFDVGSAEGTTTYTFLVERVSPYRWEGPAHVRLHKQSSESERGTPGEGSTVDVGEGDVPMVISCSPEGDKWNVEIGPLNVQSSASWPGDTLATWYDHSSGTYEDSSPDFAAMFPDNLPADLVFSLEQTKHGSNSFVRHAFAMAPTGRTVTAAVPAEDASGSNRGPFPASAADGDFDDEGGPGRPADPLPTANIGERPPIVDAVYVLASGGAAHLTPACPALEGAVTLPLEIGIEPIDKLDDIGRFIDAPVCKTCCAMALAGSKPVFTVDSASGEIVMTRDRLQIDGIGVDVPYFRIVESRRKLLSLSPTARISYRQPLPDSDAVTLTHDVKFKSPAELDAFLAEMSDARAEA
jgi:lysozyme family protein